MGSGEELREAARLMRERAEAEPSQGWFVTDFNDDASRPLWGIANDAYFNPPADEDEPWLAVEVMTGTKATAEHLASWHPAVALAVADWLDQAAIHLDGGSLEHHPTTACALDVARAYRGVTP